MRKSDVRAISINPRLLPASSAPRLDWCTQRALELVDQGANVGSVRLRICIGRIIRRRYVAPTRRFNFKRWETAVQLGSLPAQLAARFSTS